MAPRIDRHGIHRARFVDEILGTQQFQDTLSLLAIDLDRQIPDLENEARADLKEIAAEQEAWAISTWDKLCRWLGRAYKLDVDHGQIDRLQKLNEQYTLVFLPNHRSYLDPMILRSALQEHGFPPNHVLGGVNLSFWPMGPLGKRNGTVFIRREFKDDLVYKACLKAYIAYMVQRQQNLEWYIEGGRTRTGKLRPPRMGILSYLVDAFDQYADKDVMIIPVFVGYDQQYEVGAISAEEQGGTKTPESVTWMIKFARAQTVRRGRAHLRFGEPLSLGGALAETRESTDSSEARLGVSKVAFEVMHRINKVTPIMPTALVTFALLDNEDKAMTIAEGRRVLDPLLTYIKARGLDISEVVDLSEHRGLEGAVQTLVREGVVNVYDKGAEPVFWIAPNRQHEAGFYRNTLIHHLVNRAIIEIALVRAAEEAAEDPMEATWAEAKRLRDLLKYEFFFPKTSHFARAIVAEGELAYPGWTEQRFTADKLFPTMAKSRLFVAHRTIGPFLEAYGVFADLLATRAPNDVVVRDDFIVECIGVAQQRWHQGVLHSPESISRDLFGGAYQLAENRGLIEAGDPMLTAKREAFATELRAAIRRVDVIRTMAKAKEEI